MDETLERISALMKEQKIQDQQMIEYLGLPRGAFSNWKRGFGQSYYEHIDKIADKLGVSIDYLIRGEDIKTDSLNHQETEILAAYRKLSDHGRKIILENIKLIVENTSQK